MATVEELVVAGLGGASAVGEVCVVHHPWPGPWWDSPEGLVPTLGGSPLAVADVRTLAAEAHAQDELLQVDNSIATSAGCAALRLGADVAVESLVHACGELGVGLAVVAVRRGVSFDLPAAAELSPAERGELNEAYVRYLSRRSLECDAAQAIAAYLTCHPRVAHVWYPGLLRDQADHSQPDPANALAPSVLNGGFGPALDYALVDAPDVPVRIVAEASDSIIQIEQLEAILCRSVQ